MDRRDFLKALSAGAATLLLPGTSKAAQEGDFGWVYAQASVNGGFDTAGGTLYNYFHKQGTGQIEVRDANNIDTIVDLIDSPPSNAYGIAHDGQQLFASELNGALIYGWRGWDQGWSGGLGTEVSGMLGLAASGTDFYVVGNMGETLNRVSRRPEDIGEIKATWDLTQTELLGLNGLDYIPYTNELIGTNGSDYIHRLQLSPDLNEITDISSIRASGLGSDTLMGIGFNKMTRDLVMNDSGGGQYAYGVSSEAIPAVSTWGMIAATLLTMTAGTLVLNRKQQMEQYLARPE